MNPNPPNGLAAFVPGAPATQQPSSVPSGPRRVSDNVSMTDFSDQSVTKYDFELYGGKVGEIHRIQILRPDSIAKGRAHYHEKAKSILCRSVYALSGDGKQEVLVEERPCCKWLGSPAVRFAALVIKYGTDRQGNIVMPFSYELKLWRFGVDKFLNLRTINNDFPLSRFDLSVACTDEQYQKLQIGAKPECLLLHPKFPQDHKTQIEQWANASVSKLPNEIARTFASDDALRQHLQQSGVVIGGMAPMPSQGPTTPVDQPISNFDDIIAQAVPAQGQSGQ